MSYKVYRRVHRTEERCPYGDYHQVSYYEVKFLEDTGETYSYNNGYETRDEKIWVDRQGRRYYMQHSVDYTQNTSLVRKDYEDEVTLWSPYLDRNARDLAGNPLNKQTPAGPPLTLAASVATAIIKEMYKVRCS
jgi:hypothetical protein